MMSIKEKLLSMLPPVQDSAMAPVGPLTRREPTGWEDIGLFKVTDDAYGPYWIREKQFDAEMIPMFDLLHFQRLNSQQLVLIGKNWQFKDVDPMNVLYIDTETTGLAGGAGTYAFIIGMARCRDGGVQVKQLFLLDQSQEETVCNILARELLSAGALISYNGKSYDIPLLKNRFILNRIGFNWDQLPHLDLLHSVRRLWSGLDNYTLNQVEYDILGFRRQEDIPGYLIPNVYFNCVRNGDIAPLKPVFQHNVMDLISLIGITLSAAEKFEFSGQRPAAESLGIIKTYHDLELFEKAEQACASVTGHRDLQSWIKVQSQRGRMLKKCKNHHQAEKIWQEWLELANQFYIEPYEELAKYYEHIQMDPQRALDLVLNAEKRLAISMELHEQAVHYEWQQRLTRRKQRLQRKILVKGEQKS